jgi:hypothetical protein
MSNWRATLSWQVEHVELHSDDRVIFFGDPEKYYKDFIQCYDPDGSYLLPKQGAVGHVLSAYHAPAGYTWLVLFPDTDIQLEFLDACWREFLKVTNN